MNACLFFLSGKHCQVDIDDCASSPCLNGGMCIDKVNGFVCNCSERWMGDRCERPYNICDAKPCFNNATCLSANKRDFMCECLKGSHIIFHDEIQSKKLTKKYGLTTLLGLIISLLHRLWWQTMWCRYKRMRKHNMPFGQSLRGSHWGV